MAREHVPKVMAPAEKIFVTGEKVVRSREIWFKNLEI